MIVRGACFAGILGALACADGAPSTPADAGGARDAGGDGPQTPDPGKWLPVTTDGAPAGRQFHTAVWTGSEMIVWGGHEFQGPMREDGGRYDPVADRWTPMSPWVGQPRLYHFAVWTGSEMVILGGFGLADDPEECGDSACVKRGGGAYDPATDTWRAISNEAAPAAGWTMDNRGGVVWSGSEMIVWGAAVGGAEGPRGGRYDPAEDRWCPISEDGAPPRRFETATVWAGSHFVLWGGSNPFDEGDHDTGWRYDPILDTWLPTTTDGAPIGRKLHWAVSTGAEMIVWAGEFDDDGNIVYPCDGGRYDPMADVWRPVACSGEEIGFGTTHYGSRPAVWSGREMIVWGTWEPEPGAGGRYDPVRDAWTAIAREGAPSRRGRHTAIWTGEMMVVWGGYFGTTLNDGGRYFPETPPE